MTRPTPRRRRTSRQASLRVLNNLYRRRRHELTPAQRRTAQSLLREARSGRLTRAGAMRRSNALLARSGLTPQQAWRRLKVTPYYHHVLNVLAD